MKIIRQHFQIARINRRIDFFASILRFWRSDRNDDPGDQNFVVVPRIQIGFFPALDPLTPLGSF